MNAEVQRDIGKHDAQIEALKDQIETLDNAHVGVRRVCNRGWHRGEGWFNPYVQVR